MSGRGRDAVSSDALLERLADVARQLAAAHDLDHTLQLVVDLARSTIAGCDGATLMLIRDGSRMITPASTGLRAYQADQAQYETGEGPCLTALREHETIVIDDLESEDRWPQWRLGVRELGFRSMLGLRLFVGEDTMGALDLYSESPRTFDRHAEMLGQVFASHAAVAMKAAVTEAGLERALDSRDVIGQAKGVLMERERLTGEEAFERLRRLSSRRNVKLRDLARDIVETGVVPD